MDWTVMCNYNSYPMWLCILGCGLWLATCVGYLLYGVIYKHKYLFIYPLYICIYIYVYIIFIYIYIYVCVCTFCSHMKTGLPNSERILWAYHITELSSTEKLGESAHWVMGLQPTYGIGPIRRSCSPGLLLRSQPEFFSRSIADLHMFL